MRFAVTFACDKQLKTVAVELSAAEVADVTRHAIERGPEGPGGPDGPIAKSYALQRAAAEVPSGFKYTIIVPASTH